jgi:hypothetical protein
VGHWQDEILPFELGQVVLNNAAGHRLNHPTVSRIYRRMVKMGAGNPGNQAATGQTRMKKQKNIARVCGYRG